MKYSLKLIKCFICLFILVICTIESHSQQQQKILTTEQQQQIDEYKQLVIKFQNERNKNQTAHYLNKIAYIYWENEFHQEAIDHFSQSLTLNIEIGNNNGIKSIYYNLGMIYSDIEQYTKALDALHKGLQFSRILRQKENIASGLINISTALQSLERYEEAIKNLEEALNISRELNNLRLIRKCYGMLAENYEKSGNSEKTMEYYNLFSSFDKFIKDEEIKQIEVKSQAEIAKANAEKRAKQLELDLQTHKLKITQDSLKVVEQINRNKQMQIELNELALKEQEARDKIQQLIIYSLSSGIVIILIFSVLLYIQYTQKKKANKLLEQQNTEISQQKMEIELQSEKLEIINKQLEIQNKNIKASITYALTIQEAILPVKENINKVFDSFTLYRPKDIVSGDFYWFSHINSDGRPGEKVLIAVVDCTGHGVPGAFMSMIGSRLLNEIVNERKIYLPGKILELLNKEVRIALKQDQSDNNDGMDICLCCIEKAPKGKTKITFTGAKLPLFYFRKDISEINTLNGDRKSIGGPGSKKNDVPYTNQELILNSGDILYLTTDGIIDQNAPDRKRFGSKKLIEIFNANAHLSMEDQKQKLEKTLDLFQQDEEQRDDILVIGLKIIKNILK